MKSLCRPTYIATIQDVWECFSDLFCGVMQPMRDLSVGNQRKDWVGRTHTHTHTHTFHFTPQWFRQWAKNCRRVLSSQHTVHHLESVDVSFPIIVLSLHPSQRATHTVLLCQLSNLSKCWHYAQGVASVFSQQGITATWCCKSIIFILFLI